MLSWTYRTYLLAMSPAEPIVEFPDMDQAAPCPSICGVLQVPGPVLIAHPQHLAPLWSGRVKPKPRLLVGTAFVRTDSVTQYIHLETSQ